MTSQLQEINQKYTIAQQQTAVASQSLQAAQEKLKIERQTMVQLIVRRAQQKEIYLQNVAVVKAVQQIVAELDKWIKNCPQGSTDKIYDFVNKKTAVHGNRTLISIRYQLQQLCISTGEQLAYIDGNYLQFVTKPLQNDMFLNEIEKKMAPFVQSYTVCYAEPYEPMGNTICDEQMLEGMCGIEQIY